MFFMKKSGLLFIFFCQLFFSQSEIPKDFLKIPEVFDTTENLYAFIQPGEDFAYWKAFINNSDSEKAVLYESQAPVSMTILEPIPEKGFFQNCLGENCFNYIIACKNGRSVFFLTEKNLIQFIGKIDNVAEAILVAKTQGFLVDTSDLRGGSFTKDDENFYLKLYKQKKCSEVKESFTITIGRNNSNLTYKTNIIYSIKKTCD